MSVDEQQPLPTLDPSQQALDRYVASMRRPRLIYAVVIAAVVVVLVVVVTVLWSGSEVAHTTLHTTKHPAPAVALGSPSDPLRPVWQSTDRTALGTPYWIGTTVTFSAHAVSGRNGTTGKVTWSYTRSDRTVCEAIQDQGTTIAIYRHGGNCDEVTGLDSSSGTRKWTRTLDKDGAPIQGTPQYTITPITIMVTTPTVIYAFDPGSGLDRWTYHPADCTISGAALGNVGALISQTCTHPKCTGLKFCGAGPQLIMRDATTAHSDDDKDKANPDQIKWVRLGLNEVPASADQLVSAIDKTTGQLAIFDAGKGTSSTQLPLRSSSTQGGIVATVTTQAEVLWIGGFTYAINLSAQAIAWTTPTPTPPTVTPAVSATQSDTADLSTATIAVAADGAVDLINGVNGQVTRTLSAAAVTNAARVFPFGTGFVVTGPTTAVYQ